MSTATGAAQPRQRHLPTQTQTQPQIQTESSQSYSSALVETVDSRKHHLLNYYNSLESRIGYRLMLGGTRHFGYWENDTYWPFPLGPRLREMEDKLYDALALPQGSHVLDCGCGIGHVAIHLAKKGLTITGIDFIPHHLVKAQRIIRDAGLQDNITVQKGDYHDLSEFPDNTFDGLYTNETFVHANQPEKAMKEFLRVLKPGGRIVLVEYDHDDIEKAPQDLADAWRLIDHYGSVPAMTKFNTNIIQDMLEDTGFHNIETRDYSRNIVPMLRFFYLCAIVPYLIFHFLGIEHLFVNTVTAVFAWRYRYNWRFLNVSANKPVKHK